MPDRLSAALSAVSSAAAATATGLRYASYPVVRLARVLALAFAPVLALVQFVLLPVTYTVRAAVSLALFPFSLRLLERFETLYTFLGIAALIGIIVGALLHFSFSSISSTLGIDSAQEREPSEPDAGRTVSEYRTTRRKRDEDMSHPFAPQLARKAGPLRR